MTFSKESTSPVVLKFRDLFSANESKEAFEGVGGLAMAATRLLENGSNVSYLSCLSYMSYLYAQTKIFTISL
jgi:hypothetical protein